MTVCIECGTALKDMLEDEKPEYDEEKPQEPLLPEGDYRPVASGVEAGTAARLMKLFRRSGIPLKVEPHGYTMVLSARQEDFAGALGILQRAGVLPEPAEGLDKAVAAEGGPCPACGTEVRAGTAQCPECGLQLSASDEPCEKCGAVLAATDEDCPACGQRRY
jgi:hypothetical protein